MLKKDTTTSIQVGTTMIVGYIMFHIYTITIYSLFKFLAIYGMADLQYLFVLRMTQ